MCLFWGKFLYNYISLFLIDICLIINIYTIIIDTDNVQIMAQVYDK